MSEPTFASLFVDEKMEKRETERKYYAVKHNDLIQKNRYTLEKNKDNSLSLLEQKVILYALGKVKPDTKEFDFIEFNIKDFAAVLGVENNKDIYARVKEIITNLARRVMWLKSIDEEITVRWIEKAIINKRQGKLFIKFDNDLKPYLLGLYGNYTKIPLHSILRMKSKYGIMLYEILRSYYYTSHRLKFNIEDLKERLDCTSYKTFSNFKARVLLPAVDDINTYSDLYVRIEYYKQGKSYTDVIFHLHDLSNPKTEEERIEAARRFYKVEEESENLQLSLFDMIYGDNKEVELYGE